MGGGIMEYTFLLAEDIVLPNIFVYRKLLNGAPTAYRLEAAEGYTMYDTAAQMLSEEPTTGKMLVIRNYTKDVRCPRKYDFGRCTWKAIPEGEMERDEKAFLKQMQGSNPG